MMNEVREASAVDNVECSIAITRRGFAIVGEGVVRTIEKGKTKRRGKYKKVDELMLRATTVLVAHGFRPLQLMKLFGLAGRSAYSLEKKARAENERIKETSERKRREQEAISAASLREQWERPRPTHGSSFRNVRKFHS